YILLPVVHQLGEHVEASADILASFGVVGGGGGQCPGPKLLAVLEVVVQVGELDAEAAWIAADLVQGEEAVVYIKSGVLESLRHHGGGDLLKLAHEAALLGVVRFAGGGG